MILSVSTGQDTGHDAQSKAELYINPQFLTDIKLLPATAACL